MATIKENIYRAIKDFNSIKEVLNEKGVDTISMPTENYADSFRNLFSSQTCKTVEMTMTQSCTHGGGAKIIIDSVRDENASVSVLVYNGSNPVDRQLGVLITLLIEGTRWYCGMRKAGETYSTTAVEGGWDYIINIGDKYILYEM
jgi:hypothetical protein